MNEFGAIVTAWEQVRQAGETAILATIVKTEGSTYRRAGARMLFTRAGWIVGSISGGCLEADLLQTAWSRTEHGPALVVYDSTANEDIVWGFGLGCNGVVEVLLERLAPNLPAASFASETLEFLASCLERRAVGVIATVLRVEGKSKESVGDRLMVDGNGMCTGALYGTAGETEGSAGTGGNGTCGGALCRSVVGEALFADADRIHRAGKLDDMPEGRPVTHWYATPAGSIEVGFERVTPPRSLVLFGAGQDVLPVVRLAKEMGWHVTVVDPRCTVASATRFALADAVIGCTPDAIRDKIPLDAQTFTLVMTHNFLHDATLLAQLLPSPARYIGVLGPRKRLNNLLQHLDEEGMFPTSEQLSRVHGPVGLDIGADNPAEIALAIVAELHAAATNRTGSALRERQAPLHAETTAASPIQSDHQAHALFACPLY